MALSTKASVLAIKKEVTEGVPVKPSAGSDFVALQDGFSIEPNFLTLENKELKNSIGQAKQVLGREQPKAAFAHYLRHSGVEGQAPNFSLLLEAAFGLKTANGTEYQTAASSTASLVKVGTGNGVNFKKGQGMLIKDASNGYTIRPVEAISGDDLTPAFPLPGAPASGIKLGKAIQYSPVNEGHPTLSFWEYRAGTGALELLTGARVVDASWDFAAGEYINGSMSFEGIQYCFNPLIIDSTNNKLDFLDNATTRAATIPSRLYKDPHDLAAAIQDAMNGLGSTNTFTVKYVDSTGKFTITSNGTTLTLKWSTGANVANSIGTTIGADISADQTAALTYTMANPIQIGSGITPVYDIEAPIVAKDNEVLLGDGDVIAPIRPSKVSVAMPQTRKENLDVTAVSGVSGSVITGRQVKISVSALLDKYDVDKFRRFRQGVTTRFLYNFGLKSGGNWKPGHCGCIYIPTATITSFKLNDDSGLVTLEMELAAFVDDFGNPEIYLSLL